MPAAAGTQATVVIDSEDVRPAKSMFGYLEHDFPERIPRDLVVRLKPAWFRADWPAPTFKKHGVGMPNHAGDTMDLVRRCGAKYMPIPFTTWQAEQFNWGYASPAGTSGIEPFNNMEIAEPRIRAYYQWIRDTKGAKASEIAVNLWNEPDSMSFFACPPADHKANLKTLVRRTIEIGKEELGPDLRFVGPSYSQYNSEALNALFYTLTEFCEMLGSLGLQMHYADFHFLQQPREGAFNGLAGQLLEARKQLIEDKSVWNRVACGVREIICTEWTGSAGQGSTGTMIAYLKGMHDGGAGGGIMALFNPDANFSTLQATLTDPALGGVQATFPKWTPRTRYWLLLRYADMLAEMCKAWAFNTPGSIAFNEGDVSVLASNTGGGGNLTTTGENPIDLIGICGSRGAGGVGAEWSSGTIHYKREKVRSIPRYGNASTVQVTVRKYVADANTGLPSGPPLAVAPTQVSANPLTLTIAADGSVSFDLLNALKDEAYEIEYTG